MPRRSPPQEDRKHFNVRAPSWPAVAVLPPRTSSKHDLLCGAGRFRAEEDRTCGVVLRSADIHLWRLCNFCYGEGGPLSIRCLIKHRAKIRRDEEEAETEVRKRQEHSAHPQDTP